MCGATRWKVILNLGRTLLLLFFLVTLKATGEIAVEILEPISEPPVVVYTADGPTLQVVL
jgi:hypothetical protein